ncbi:MAG: hypothetical protein LKJ50_07185 [Clostridiales bacterium]|jgi:hypothetical protein|nr:hypothetical protein [Clostridiales bacterium]MCI2161434.1 hypothetical protein [Oscillospiraceae bacterium]MCI1961423.1 hypothetical protein [Clostridiales bacterium]MCI2022168.1 hypothetical protein [Clostridiales bacterium]MCI2025817.1 hypothetical protein [Clostridiales bacterium]
MKRQEIIQQLKNAEKYFSSHEEIFCKMRKEQENLTILQEKRQYIKNIPKKYFWMFCVSVYLLLILFLAPWISTVLNDVDQNFTPLKCNNVFTWAGIAILCIFVLTKLIFALVERIVFKKSLVEWEKKIENEQEKIKPLEKKIHQIFDFYQTESKIICPVPESDCDPAIIRQIISMFELDNIDSVEDALDEIHRKEKLELKEQEKIL